MAARLLSRTPDPIDRINGQVAVCDPRCRPDSSWPGHAPAAAVADSGYRTGVTELSASKRARLPNSAFAYIDSKGRRRLPIHDGSHVRNALARFNRVAFEDEAAKERARQKLLRAAKKHGIVPIGFFTGQLRSGVRDAAAGRLVIELGRIGAPGELEQRLRDVLRDPTLSVLDWSESASAYLDREGRPATLPTDGDGRAVTLLERRGRPMTALVHDAAVLTEQGVVETVTAAVRLAVENERLQGEVEARAVDVRTLPVGFVTFLVGDIEDSTGLLRRLGDRYATLLAELRGILRTAIRRSGGREIDARADEILAVFERAGSALEGAVTIQKRLRQRAWPDELEVRLRIGIHSGRPTLTDTGYVGLALHTAARVGFAGHGGQILVSEAARDAIEAARPAGVRFRSLGAYRLHGLPEPEVLYQVEADGLAADFPPPRTAGAPGWLPSAADGA
jgi:class 3 adenylate cyclase